MSRYHSKPEDDEVVRNWRNETPRAIAYAVAQVTKDGVYALLPELTELLEHEDWSVRLETLTGLLVRMEQHELLGRAIDGLENEASEVAEDIPMILWRYVEELAPDRYGEIMELLVQRLLAVPDNHAKRTTYNAIMQLSRIGMKRRLDHAPADFRLDRDVDWEPLLKWVPQDLAVPEGVISTREVSSPEDLDLLVDDSALTVDRVAAMERLLLDRRQEARSRIQALYRSDDPELAKAALANYVAVWGTVDVVAGGRALKSTHEDVQLAAVDAYAEYSRNLGGGRNLPVVYLVKFLEKDPVSSAARAAYVAVLEALAPHRVAGVPDPFDPTIDIDWDLVKPAS